jgi:hypothetical protein
MIRFIIDKSSNQVTTGRTATKNLVLHVTEHEISFEDQQDKNPEHQCTRNKQ